MRQLVIAVVGVSLGMALSAHAQTGYGPFGGPVKTGGFGKARNAQPQPAAGTWGVAPPEPYRPHHSAPDYTKSTGSIGSTGGGEDFKPYKPFEGSSVYETPKPAKPKYGSTY